MKNSTIWTALGAIVIAVFLVYVLSSLIAIVFKLLIVAIVAVVVFFVLRGIFVRSRRE